MKITVLGGHKEIGGNKILVEHKGTKILLDFGMSFSQAGKYFSEFLQPRKCASLTDFFEFGLLPQIKGACCRGLKGFTVKIISAT
jgi:ribonuclease J